MLAQVLNHQVHQVQSLNLLRANQAQVLVWHGQVISIILFGLHPQELFLPFQTEQHGQEVLGNHGMEQAIIGGYI